MNASQIKTLRAAIGFLLLAPMLFAGDVFEISRYTIDGGGEMRLTAGEFELSGTIGQPDAGTMAAGGFELTGGFWFQTPPGDCNENGSVGLFDHGQLIACLSGPGGAAPVGNCRCIDVNASGTVDLADVAEIQQTFSGE